MQLIIIILGRGSAPAQTPPRTDNNYKKNESVTNDSLSQNKCYTLTESEITWCAWNERLSHELLLKVFYTIDQ